MNKYWLRHICTLLFLIAPTALYSAPAEVESAPWNYKSTKYGFSITLPDTGWIERPSSIHANAAFLKKGFAMRADIFVIPCETEAAFQELAKRIKAEMDAGKGISDTSHVMGITEAARPYQFSQGIETNAYAPAGIYLGQSVVWIGDKKIALRVCFEGETKDRPPTIHGVDPVVLIKSARSIGLSVK
jgi:hypothetical protein